MKKNNVYLIINLIIIILMMTTIMSGCKDKAEPEVTSDHINLNNVTSSVVGTTSVDVDQTDIEIDVSPENSIDYIMVEYPQVYTATNPDFALWTGFRANKDNINTLNCDNRDTILQSIKDSETIGVNDGKYNVDMDGEPYIFVFKDGNLANTYHKDTDALHRYDYDRSLLRDNIKIIKEKYSYDVLKHSSPIYLELEHVGFFEKYGEPANIGLPYLIGAAIDIVEDLTVLSVGLDEDGHTIYTCSWSDGYGGELFKFIWYPNELELAYVEEGYMINTPGAIYAGWDYGEILGTTEHIFVVMSDHDYGKDGRIGVNSDKTESYDPTEGIYGYDPNDIIEESNPLMDHYNNYYKNDSQGSTKECLDKSGNLILKGDNVRHGFYTVFHGYVEDTNEYGQVKIRWISINNGFGEPVANQKHVRQEELLTGFSVGGSNWVDADRLRIETSGW